MLVCSVSLRSRRIVAAITAEAGAAAASDVVQMPGLGQLVSEDLTAANSLSATLVSGPAIIIEGTSAGATAAVPGPVAAAMVAAATATSTQGATVGTIAVVYGAVLDGTFVDPQPPSTLLGTGVPDSGPITVFEP